MCDIPVHNGQEIGQVVLYEFVCFFFGVRAGNESSRAKNVFFAKFIVDSTEK